MKMKLPKAHSTNKWACACMLRASRGDVSDKSYGDGKVCSPKGGFTAKLSPTVKGPGPTLANIPVAANVGQRRDDEGKGFIITRTRCFQYQRTTKARGANRRRPEPPAGAPPRQKRFYGRGPEELNANTAAAP